MKKSVIFTACIILCSFIVKAQTISSKDLNKHLFIYRTDANNFSSYKIFINSQKYKIGTTSLFNFKINNNSIDLIAGFTEINKNVFPVKIDFSSRKNIYLRVSINMYGSNITEVSELTFLLETASNNLKKQDIEVP